MSTYRAQWSDQIVIWRDLTWSEYRQLIPPNELVFPKDSGIIDPMWAMEVYKTCCISGPTPPFVMAGIVQQIAAQQLVNNPFAGDYESIDKALTNARNKVNSSYLNAAKALICAAFHYKMEEIDNWSADIFFMRLAQSELVLGEVIKLKDPNAKEVPAIGKKGKTFPVKDNLGRPLSPSQVKGVTTGNIGDPNVPKSQQRGELVETFHVTSSKYPPK